MRVVLEVDPDRLDKEVLGQDDAQVPSRVQRPTEQNLFDAPTDNADLNDLHLGKVKGLGEFDVAVAVDLGLKTAVVAIAGRHNSCRSLEPAGKSDFGVVEVHEESYTELLWRCQHIVLKPFGFSKHQISNGLVGI